MNPSLPALIARLHAFSGIAHKRDIQQVARELRDAWPNPSPNGDDCALIPDGSGYKLLAIEGFINRFVAEDPWFAGWCGVMVNLSDIAAMGGRPLAVVNALWDEAQPHAAQILQGMAAASRAYQVPIVGGHTNLRSDRSQLAVAVLGETASPLSSSAAQAGQTLMVAINLQGRWHPPGNNWDAATRADPAELRRALALLPELAAEGSLCAAKDISQAGLAGTLTMMLESCGLGAEVTLEQIPIPAEIDLEQWLCAFPSFGFLLAVDEARCHEVAQRFAACGIACAAAVTVSFVKIGGNIFLYVVSAVLLICAAAYLYIQYLAPYRAFKKLDKSFLAEQEFDFYEDKLELIEHGEKRIKRVIPYSKIQKVCETKHAFYIYIAADSAFILTKTALSSSSVERLRNLFKDKGIKIEE